MLRPGGASSPENNLRLFTEKPREFIDIYRIFRKFISRFDFFWGSATIPDRNPRRHGQMRENAPPALSRNEAGTPRKIPQVRISPHLRCRVPVPGVLH